MEKQIVDTFKTYEEYAGKFIIENYIRHKYIDTVVAVFDTLDDALVFMDENKLWDDCLLYAIDEDGNNVAWEI